MTGGAGACQHFHNIIFRTGISGPSFRAVSHDIMHDVGHDVSRGEG
jgi:hypothetical protein